MSDVDQLRQRHRHLIDRITRHELLDEFVTPLPADPDDLLTLDEAVKLTNSLALFNPFNRKKVPVNKEETVSKTLKISSTEERTNSKEKCGLCTHYFDKESVVNSVSNYRIQELRKQWNAAFSTGKKHNYPSYKYSTSKICCFCSQLFLPDDRGLDQKNSYSKEMSVAIGLALTNSNTGNDTDSVGSSVITEMEMKETQPMSSIPILTETAKQEDIRTDLTLPRSSYHQVAAVCYQSSLVDTFHPEKAITPPYSVPAKTRRQVDPWWEIYFNQIYNIFSLEFSVPIVSRQKVDGRIMLLRDPIGFDDPFIDSVSSKAVLWKSFSDIIDKTKSTDTLLKFHWQVPTNTFISTVRIQIVGIHCLSVQDFHVFQGDAVLDGFGDTQETTSPEINSRPMTSSSMNMFSTVSLEFLRARRKEMMSQDARRRRAFGQKMKPNSTNISKYNNIEDFKHHIEKRYERLQEWVNNVQRNQQIFHLSELKILFRVVFMHCVEYDFKKYQQYLEATPFNQSMFGAHVAEDYRPTASTTSMDSLGISQGSIDTLDRVKYGIAKIDENEIFGDGLIQQYPRCCFFTLLQRIRTLLRWILGKRHVNILGILAINETLMSMANDVEERIFMLELEFKRVEKYCLQIAERDNVKLTLFSPPLNSKAAIGTPASSVNPALLYGCSWSQFIIIMDLFCRKQTEKIPEVAYNLSNNELSHISILDASYDLVHPYLNQLAERINVPKGKVISFIQSAYDSQPSSPTNIQIDDSRNSDATATPAMIEGLDDTDTNTFLTAVAQNQSNSPKGIHICTESKSQLASPCHSTKTKTPMNFGGSLLSPKQGKTTWKKLLSPKSKSQSIPFGLQENKLDVNKVDVKPSVEKGPRYNLVSGGRQSFKALARTEMLSRLNSASADVDQTGDAKGKDAFALMLQRRYSHGNDQKPTQSPLTDSIKALTSHTITKLPDLPESAEEDMLKPRQSIAPSIIAKGKSNIHDPARQPSVSFSADNIPVLQLRRATSSMRKQKDREDKLKQFIEFKSTDGILALYTPRKQQSSHSLLNPDNHDEGLIPSELPDLEDMNVLPPKNISISQRKLKFLEKKWNLDGSESAPNTFKGGMRNQLEVLRPFTSATAISALRAGRPLSPRSWSRLETSVSTSGDPPLPNKSILSYHAFNLPWGGAHSPPKRSITAPPVQNLTSSSGTSKPSSKTAELAKAGITNIRTRVCALCKLRVSKDSTMRVLTKHLLRLRQYLSTTTLVEHRTTIFSPPSSPHHSVEKSMHSKNNLSDTLSQDISKHSDEVRSHFSGELDEINELEDPDMAMYNLVSLCPFCSQFIDADKPDGVCFPSYQPQLDKAGMLSAIITGSTMASKPFFDYRYQSTPEDVQALHQFRNSISRAAARNVAENS